MKPRLPLAALLLLLAPAAAFAEVRLPALFGNGAVVQRGRPIPVWGWAEPREVVTVTLAGSAARTTADAQGRWRVELPALNAGGPHTLNVAGSNRVTVEDVLVGDVWVCAGQSNMAWPLHRSQGGAAAVAAADAPRIRLFTVAKSAQAEPQDDCRGAWVPCTPKSAPMFSAVAYYFGRRLERELGVPLGLVNASWDGTRAESWVPQDAVTAEPALAGLWAQWEQRLAAFDPAVEAEYVVQFAAWERAAAEAKAKGEPAPRKPKKPADPRKNRNCPGSIWNGTVAPLTPYGVRGVIWYQGEANAQRAAQYRVLFPALIRTWRDAWHDADLPFLFVQLAAFGAKPPGQTAPSGGPSEWAELREAQFLTHRLLPHTGMAVAIDIGDVASAHPLNKQDVGCRLARWALREVYGEDIVCSGPLYRAAEPVEGGLRIAFDHAVGLRTKDDRPPAGFAVAGDDGVFVPGVARIDGDAVVVTRPEGGPVTHVRYAWADAPAEPLNLVNEAGLPASPFRTDDLPLVTEGRD